MSRDYVDMAAAKKGITRFGLSGMTIRFDTKSQRITPVVICELVEDMRYVRDEKGFAAELMPTTITPGTNVRLAPSVVGEDHTEVAKIAWFLDGIEGGVYLDRPLGGTRYWNLDSLVALVREDA